MPSGRHLPLFCFPAISAPSLSPLECAVPSTIEICTILVQITPLDSALTDTVPVTPLECAVPKNGGGGGYAEKNNHTPSRGRSLRTKSVSWIGSESHSTAIVVTGWSGASAGSPVNRTRNRSCSNFTGCPVASNRADFTPVFSPESATVSPGQKYTCMYSVLPLRVKQA